jgi:hypothetical protein
MPPAATCVTRSPGTQGRGSTTSLRTCACICSEPFLS